MLSFDNCNPGLNGARRCSLLIALALSLTASSAAADLLDDAQKMRPILGEQYEEAYSHVEMHAVGKSTRSEYLRNGELLRVTTTKTTKTDSGLKVGGVAVIAVSPDYRFQAGKADANQPFKLAEFHPLTAETVLIDEITSCRPVFAYGYLDLVRVDNLLTGRNPRARPISAAETTLDGKRVIKVVVDVTAEGGESLEWQLFFLPGSWALAGATQPMMGGSTFHYKTSYHNDDPLRLQSFKRWRTTIDAPQVKKDQSDIDITSINYRTVPESEFRLTALGLEEPVINRPSPWWWKLLWINALIFGTLGIWFAILAVRRRRRAGASDDRLDVTAHG